MGSLQSPKVMAPLNKVMAPSKKHTHILLNRPKDHKHINFESVSTQFELDVNLK